MNYIKIINQFWKIRRKKRISSVQADVYYALLQECNEREWENPFEFSNKMICATIGISEPTLIDARNRLQQYGLIKFKPGRRNELPPVYTIIYPVTYLNNLSRNRDESIADDIDETEMNDEHYNKRNETKPNVNSSEAKASGAVKKKESSSQEEKKKSSAQRKKEELEATPHWAKMVDVWFVFYESNKGHKPSFEGEDPRALKHICDNLQKRATSRGFEWTADKATDTLKHFLQHAYGLKWLNENFLLPNLRRQFDKIISDATNGTGNTGTVASAFSKIDAMHRETGANAN